MTDEVVAVVAIGTVGGDISVWSIDRAVVKDGVVVSVSADESH